MFRIRLQFPGMRKPDECIVYPRQADNPDLLVLQGARTIGAVNTKTGKGVVNYRGSHAKYFVHLRPELGAVPWQYKPELVRALQEIRPNSGDLIGSSPETGPVYVA